MTVVSTTHIFQLIYGERLILIYVASVRKAHNSGKNHIANVRNYYAGVHDCRGKPKRDVRLKVDILEIGQDKAQAIIDEITKAYENSAAGKLRG